jgi:hypothetical protein
LCKKFVLTVIVLDLTHYRPSEDRTAG